MAKPKLTATDDQILKILNEKGVFVYFNYVVVRLGYDKRNSDGISTATDGLERLRKAKLVHMQEPLVNQAHAAIAKQDSSFGCGYDPSINQYLISDKGKTYLANLGRS